MPKAPKRTYANPYQPGRVTNARKQGGQPEAGMVNQPASYYTMANIAKKSRREKR